MFTKCPSCHTEISFEPPSNAPAGYKHRIKCPNPSCGVTISVALPSKQTAAPAPVGNQVGSPALAPGETSAQAALEATSSSGKVRYKGRARSLVMLLFSLVILAVGVLGFLIAEDIMPAEIGSFDISSLTSFNAIGAIKSISEDFSAFFSNIASVPNIVVLVIVLNFVVAAVLFLSNLIGFIAGKYGKSGNVIFTLLAFLTSVVTIYALFLVLMDAGWPIDFAEYSKAVFENQLISVIAVGISFVAFVFSIIFAAIKKKVKEPKIA